MATQAFPVITGGAGAFLMDSDGRHYLDAISSWWACNLGHGHPRLIKAIQRQAAELQQSMLGDMTHPRAIELAARLADLCGAQGRRVFFASDGASAVEAALKIAVQYWYNRGQPQRQRFLSLEGAYHGDTLGAVAVGYQPGFHQPFRQLLFPVHRVPAPFCAACQWQPTCQHQCLAALERMLSQHAPEIAAMIVEPLCQCAAGMRIYRPDCLGQLAALCRRHGVLLIADEVAVGWGRTGSLLAFMQAGIEPDIICLGKGLSGGYLPLSATVVQQELFESFTDQPADHTFYHGHTFAGNPLAAAAALEMLRIYDDERIVARAWRLGEIIARAWPPLAELPGVSRVRHLGMIAALDLVAAHGQSAAQRAAALRDCLLKRGILIRPLGEVVYLMPPLIIDEQALRVLIAELAQAISEH